MDVAESRRLVAIGVDVNGVDDNGWTALHVAATFGDKRTTKRLAEGGAKTDVRDIHGTTPLMYVAAEGGDRACTASCCTPRLAMEGNDFQKQEKRKTYHKTKTKEKR